MHVWPVPAERGGALTAQPSGRGDSLPSRQLVSEPSEKSAYQKTKHDSLFSSLRLAIWAFKPRFVWRRCSTRRRTSPLTTGGAPGPGATVAIGGGTMAAPLRCGEDVIGAMKDEPGDW